MILKYLVHYIIESNNCLFLEWRSISFLFPLITMLPVTTPGLRIKKKVEITATFKNYLSLEGPELDATERLDFKYELRCFSY